MATDTRGSEQEAPLGRSAVVLALWIIFGLAVHPVLYAWLQDAPQLDVLEAQAAARLAYFSLIALALVWSVPLIPKPGWRGTLFIILWVAVLLAGSQASLYEIAALQDWLQGMGSALDTRVLVAVTLFYVVLIAIPFMPGVELGLAMIVLLGRNGVFLVYPATVLGMLLPYVAGRLMPSDLVGRLARWLANGDGDRPGEALLKRFQRSRVGRLVSHNRALTILVLFALPGNAAIGGGGGISLACGMGRVLRDRVFFLIILLFPLPAHSLVYFGLLNLEELAVFSLPATATDPETDFPQREFAVRGATIRFTAGDRFEIIREDVVVARGDFSSQGDTLTLVDRAGPSACPDIRNRGIYRWWSEVDGLGIRRIRDFCYRRVRLLDNSTLRAIPSGNDESLPARQAE